MHQHRIDSETQNYYFLVSYTIPLRSIEHLPENDRTFGAKTSMFLPKMMVLFPEKHRCFSGKSSIIFGEVLEALRNRTGQTSRTGPTRLICRIIQRQNETGRRQEGGRLKLEDRYDRRNENKALP